MARNRHARSKRRATLRTRSQAQKQPQCSHVRCAQKGQKVAQRWHVSVQTHVCSPAKRSEHTMQRSSIDVDEKSTLL
eukprot:1580905-Prymnesium_polylepis.2